MEREIRDTLDRIETREDVRVLYAVESGSRAWGFASTDSDWDVRFLYLRRPEWYLSVQRRRDVLEYPLADGLDVSGWDLKKALGLFAKSNPPLLEWLRSPIVYREAFSAAARLRVLAADYFSPRSCMHHYLSMAEGNYREYLQRDPVRVKKYFYVLRPVLACRWIQMHGTTPPTEFAPWWRTSCRHACVRSSRPCSHASAPATSWPRVPGSRDQRVPGSRACVVEGAAGAPAAGPRARLAGPR